MLRDAGFHNYVGIVITNERTNEVLCFLNLSLIISLVCVYLSLSIYLFRNHPSSSSSFLFWSQPSLSIYLLLSTCSECYCYSLSICSESIYHCLSICSGAIHCHHHYLFVLSLFFIIYLLVLYLLISIYFFLNLAFILYLLVPSLLLSIYMFWI